jgi:tetratricopeptide (TPR) repeat protein
MMPGADPEMGRALLAEAVAETDSLTEFERLQVMGHHAQFVERDLEHAAEVAETLLSIYPDKASARHNLALIYERLGRIDEAIAEYKRAIEIDPNFVVAYNGLVWVLRRVVGDTPAIIDWATRELEIADDQPWPFLNLSWAYLAVGDAEGAIAMAERGVEVAPNLHFCPYHLGHALKISGRYTDAADAFERVLELRPTEYWAHYHAGYVLALAGDSEAARHHFAAFKAAVEREVEKEPKSALYRLWLDLALVQLGEEPRSGISREQLKPSDPSVTWHLAQLYAITNRPHEAIELLEKALTDGAENPIWILCHPNLDSLHDEPRYQALKRTALNLG